MANSVTTGEFPLGTILPFGGLLNEQSLEASGWLYCNGDTVSRTTYAGLFEAIGTAYGSGDGSTTFTLPNLQDTFMRGVTTNTKRDPGCNSRTAQTTGGNTGAEVGSVEGFATGQPSTAFTIDSAGDHTHSVQHIPTDNSSYAVAGSYQAIWNGGSAPTGNAGNHTHTITGGDSETRPINIGLFFIIRYK